MGLKLMCVTAHPDDHVGHRGGRNEGDQRLELLLLLLGQVLVEHLQRQTEADAEEHGHADHRHDTENPDRHVAARS